MVSMLLHRLRPARPAPGRHHEGLLVRPGPGLDLPVHGRVAASPTAPAVAVTAAQRDADPTQLDSMKPLVKGVFYRVPGAGLQPVQGAVQGQPGPGRHQAGRPARELPGAADRPDQVRRDHQLVHRRARASGEVQDQQRSWTRCSPRAEQVHRRRAWVMAALMVVCSVLLIATTIRQTAFSRRRETGIMRLVGASNVRHPAAVHPRDAHRDAARRRPGLRCAVGRDPVRHHRERRQVDPDHLHHHPRRRARSRRCWSGVGAVVAMATAWLTLRRYLRV